MKNLKEYLMPPLVVIACFVLVMAFAQMANAAGDIDFTWTNPDAREDDEPIKPGEIAGNKIYYGNESGIYHSSIMLNGEFLSEYKLSITKGSYYFVITTLDTSGRESQFSKEMTVVIGNSTALFSGDLTGSVKEDYDPNGNGLLEINGTVRVKDVDTGDSSIAGESITTPYGSLTIESSGEWMYGAERDNAEINALNDGESIIDNVTIRSVDSTEAIIAITIQGVTDVIAAPKPVKSFTGQITIR